MTGLSPSNSEFGGAEVEQPPPEVAFPHGEGGSAKPRRMRGAQLQKINEFR